MNTMKKLELSVNSALAAMPADRRPESSIRGQRIQSVAIAGT